MTEQRRRPCALCGMPTKAASGICSRHTCCRETLVCVCDTPYPDRLGECTICGRLVVTYARANRHLYRATYPDQWQRALDLGLGRP